MQLGPEVSDWMDSVGENLSGFHSQSTPITSIPGIILSGFRRNRDETLAGLNASWENNKRDNRVLCNESGSQSARSRIINIRP